MVSPRYKLWEQNWGLKFRLNPHEKDALSVLLEQFVMMRLVTPIHPLVGRMQVTLGIMQKDLSVSYCFDLKG